MNAIFLDTEGNRLAPPAARSLAAIRKAQLAKLHKNNDPSGRDGKAMRAWQYALAMRGIETKYREFAYSVARHCEFARAPDGSERVRAVMLDDGRYEIPNWDFVPKLLYVDETEGVFA